MFPHLLRSKKAKLWGGVIIAIVAVVGFVVLKNKPKNEYESVIVIRGELVQEVSVTGKVKAAQSVDLQFQNSGRIASINYKAGAKVYVGSTITSLYNQDLQAAVLSAQAELDKINNNFASLSDPTISSSLRTALDNAKNNLEQVIIKANADLASDYSTAFNDLNEAMNQISGSQVVMQDIRERYFSSGTDTGSYLRARQDEVNFKLTHIRTTFPAIDQPGTQVTAAIYSQIDASLQEMISAYSTMAVMFSYLQDLMQDNLALISSSTDRAKINTEAAAASSMLSTVGSTIRAISDQRVLNDKNIADAKAQLANAQSAFPTREDIVQKEAALLSAKFKLSGSLITAPFTGVISQVNFDKGETVNSSQVVVSMISASGFQIEAAITEIDISKIQVGDLVQFTLDAYGSNRVFQGNVSSVDPGQTIIDGVTTYKTMIDFSDTAAILRPDMTANLDIQTEKKENVISVPQRAVITNDGKLVRVVKDGKVVEVEVETGLAGKGGMIEITRGLNEGDEVVTFINE